MRDCREWTHERMIEIELLVQPPIKELLLDRCLEENMTETADGRIHLRMAFVESDLGYGYLMQYGEGCECVAPAHVRQELIRRIDAMRRQYQGG